MGDGVGVGEVLGVMVAPGDGDGFHAGVFRGVEVDGGVSDEGAVVGGEAEGGGDLECSGGVWLVGEAFAVPEDGGEGVLGE